ncbi:hypothetical protein [Paenibacillus sp. FSL R7-0337]|uniref:hypothetical protein n=1 Tax=Paenibacillus sp. FSL R7-0337 TaxID=1926588 RepID=UPI00096C8493|nr:hypothetical protein [Paenibacillus sp. FSL R7-0337]OMG00990.1 hypothetical protein BK147_01035 [Paenibacillus sp. FSL R7-0337]
MADEGCNQTASGACSHAEGSSTVVLEEHVNSHIIGCKGETVFFGSWHLANGNESTQGMKIWNRFC